MRPGQPVSFEVDALNGARLTGRIERIAPATGSEFSLLRPDNATGNFTKVVQRLPVRIAIDGPAAARRLRPGLSVVTTWTPRRHEENRPARHAGADAGDGRLRASAPAAATKPGWTRCPRSGASPTMATHRLHSGGAASAIRLCSIWWIVRWRATPMC